MEKERTVKRILDLLDQLFRTVRGVAHGQWLNLDLTVSQVKVILMLFTDGVMRMGTLASELGVSLPTATGIVDRLEERSLVLREGDPRDRRVVLCRLSEAGRKLAANLWEVGQQQTRQLLETMTSEELQLVEGAVRAFLRTIGVVHPGLATQQTTIEEA